MEYTLKARLRKAGANFNNIFSVDLKNERFSEIKFNSELLKSLIEDVKPTLVVFDPLQAFVPVDMQMGQRNAMRACLTSELDEAAESAGISKNTLSRAKTELRKKKLLSSEAEGFGNSKVFYSYLLSTSH